MAEKVPMTALSPTMEEGTIISWNKKEGDTVAAGDVLCEVETDKTSVEYESSQEGTLLRIIVGVDGSASVGQTIAIIGEKDEDLSGILSEVEAEGSASAGPVKEEPAPSAPEAPASPAPRESSESGETKNEETKAAPLPPKEDSPGGSRIKASPLAVKLAAERNINLSLVKGTGTGGRIIQRDIEEFRGVPGGAGAVGGTVTGGAGGSAVPADQEIPVTGKRAVIAKRLSESMYTAPHYYLTTSVVMEKVVEARKLLNESASGKVSLNAFFIRFVAEAIKRHPGINATWRGETILQHGSIDIGLAVDAGNGLITPVVRNCGNRGVRDIETDLVDLIEKARTGKLKPEEYSDATFTISNLGSFGVEEFTAIINPPGSAILALGAGKPTPVVRGDGSIGAATVMKMTLSCDHRVIDGAAGGRFLRELQLLMEEPARLLF
ncbi:MAG: 2-oxo acid dehydrogenase subunit E2 [Spirochaetaceae bacterium]|nr:MAG: 2-oxo acid dehydrogenase subunit E2 [Spirochaetaceae bacterium]